MKKIQLDADDKADLVRRLQTYFEDELEHELGTFDAGFLLDFLTETLGPHFYNRGLVDARAVFEKRIEGVMEAIYEIEMPIAGRR